MITNKLRLYQAAQILHDKTYKLCLQHNKLMYKYIIQLTNDNN